MTVFHNITGKMLVLLLVVCLLVSFGLAPAAQALAVSPQVVYYGAEAVVAAIMTAMGIKASTDPTYFKSMVDNCIIDLRGKALVDTKNNIALVAPEIGGAVAIGATVIDAVRDFLFNGSDTFTAPISAPAFSISGGYTSGTFSFNVCSHDMSVTFSNASTNFVPLVCYTYNSSSKSYTAFIALVCYGAHNTIKWASGSTSTCVDAVPNHPGYYYFEVSTIGGGYSTWSFTSPIQSLCYNNYSHWYDVPWPAGFNVNSGINLIGTGNDLDKDSTPDVIYPGWAERATNIDTNIEQDLDNDGAIDNVISADKYYPLTVPLDLTDVFDQVKDWTQEQAQAGTKEAAVEATKEDAKDTTKTDSDSYSIGSASDYTFDLHDFFPFCIPFDIYDMLSVLAADPVAPSFDYSFPVLGVTHTVRVDLSSFDTVAQILRTAEALAFAIGLAFVTKKLIQGGD